MMMTEDESDRLFGVLALVSCFGEYKNTGRVFHEFTCNLNLVFHKKAHSLNYDFPSQDIRSLVVGDRWTSVLCKLEDSTAYIFGHSNC